MDILKKYSFKIKSKLANKVRRTSKKGSSDSLQYRRNNSLPFFNTRAKIGPKIVVTPSEKTNEPSPITRSLSDATITLAQRRANKLKIICANSGVCMAFGKENKKIKEHFDEFTNFKYVTEKIKRIGKPSKNGFINQLTYNRRGYIAYTILKSSANEMADNLLYEYLVGQYINKQCLLFSCFLETYGVFKYTSNDTWDTMKKIKIKDPSLLKECINIPPINSREDFDIACTHSKYICIQIQHMAEAINLCDLLDNIEFCNNELLYILYQIYLPLYCLNQNFTHYDLHSNNIMIYEPIKGQTIDYCYILNDETKIEFKSRYIAKIIDYGKSFFKDEESHNELTKSSSSILKVICQRKACQIEYETSEPDVYETECGTDYGFYWLQDVRDTKHEQIYINSSKSNISHDLRLLYDIFGIMTQKKRKLHLAKYGTEPFPELLTSMYSHINLIQLLSKVVFNNNYGTIENSKHGLPNKINNVIDAYHAIEEELKLPQNITQNENYYRGIPSIGRITIYENGRKMKYDAFNL